MSLEAGTKLGRYEIRSQIGAGGMGEVYRARDNKLNRDVAIKVLPPRYSQDQTRLHRFEQEAQAAGGLNHPNILAIHDVGTHDGAPYVVSELLEGEVLRDRLHHGSLPPRKAVDYALQVARGLAAAHEKKIVHRDIKPDNIFITGDDRITILDFGLAKLFETVEAGQPQTDVPTRKVNTGPGAILGTVGYMAPEQVRGDGVDHRTDIFALGVILYEMLAGQRAFRGDSAVETLNAILKDDPPEVGASGKIVSPAVERIMRRCLEKRPEERFQSARDLAFALEALSDPGRSTTTEIVPPSVSRFRREHLAWLLAGLLLLTSVGLLLAYFRRQPPRSYSSQFMFYPPEKTSLLAWDLAHPFAISPDGRQLALVLTVEAQSRLWLRRLDSLTLQPLENTDGAQNPFWSPDGRYIAFFAGGKLKKISVSGGVPLVLCDAPPNSNSGTWNAQDIILFTIGQLGRGIQSVNAGGGEVAEVSKLDPTQDVYHFWPQFLPDGRHFLYLAGKRRRDETKVCIGSLDGSENKVLMQANSLVIYSPPGYLLYLREGALLAQPFDASSLSLNGEQLTVADHVGNFSPTGNAYFSISKNGDVLAYMPGTVISRLVWQNASGTDEAMFGPPGDYLLQRLSPDGQKVAVDVYDPRDRHNDIWIYDLPRATFTRFTFDRGLENGPVWSPDGQLIAYSRDRDGPPHLFMKRLGDSGEGEMLLSPADGPQVPTDWSPDGQFLLYRSYSSKTKSDLLILPLTGERKPLPFAQSLFNETDARISPDGKWVVYVSDETGRREVYVDRFPEGGKRSQVSNAGGKSPRWHPNGKELFYVSGDQMLTRLTIKPGDTVETGPPTKMFLLQSRNSEYEVSRDGQRFLMNTTSGIPPAPLTVSTNWTANLKH